MKFKKSKTIHSKNPITNLKNNFSLLIGKEFSSQKEIYIPEKGLYQNILVTGTIGSRQNEFCYVSIIKPIVKIPN